MAVATRQAGAPPRAQSTGRAPGLGEIALHWAPIVSVACLASSGELKQVPFVAAVPIDFTLLTMIMVVLSSAISLAFAPRLPSPLQLGVLGLFLVMAAAGSGPIPEGFYANDKFQKLWTITFVALLGGIFAVRNERDLRHLLFAVWASAFVVSGGLPFGTGSADATGRLTGATGGSIFFGQAAGLVILGVLVVALVGEKWTRNRVAFAAVIVGLELWILFSIASRGPIQSLVVGSIVALFLGLRMVRGRKVGRRTMLMFVGVVGLVTIGWINAPQPAKDRILLYGSGGSADIRLQFWQVTWGLVDGSPFGHGWGSWSRLYLTGEVPPLYTYPHNLFLELWYEVGLVGLLAFVMMGVLVARNLFRHIRTSPVVAVFGLSLIAYLMMGAMFSGDINNRRMFFAVIGGSAAVLAAPAELRTEDDEDELDLGSPVSAARR
ncbi:MAG: O-antigen ligase family protein [Actinomycetota bacterium]